jgi:excinuclease ABC subunit A
VIAAGTPEDVAVNARSFTGHYLAPLLQRGKVAAE